MEPPEPLERCSSHRRLEPGDRLRLIIDCMPHPLFRVLERNGYGHREEPGTESLYEITIWRNGAIRAGRVTPGAASDRAANEREPAARSSRRKHPRAAPGDLHPLLGSGGRADVLIHSEQIVGSYLSLRRDEPSVPGRKRPGSARFSIRLKFTYTPPVA
jgi:hypothetical protein